MRQIARPLFLAGGQLTLEQCMQVLWRIGDLPLVTIDPDSPHDQYPPHLEYRMAEVVPQHLFAQIRRYDPLDTIVLSIRGTKQDLQQGVEKIAWI